MKLNRGPEARGAHKSKFRNFLAATFEPTSKFPGVFAIIVFLGADKAAMVNDSGRVVAFGGSAAPVLTAALTAIYVYLPLALLTHLRMRFQKRLGGAFAFFVTTLLSISTSVFLIEVTLGPDRRLWLNNEIRLFIAAVLVSSMVAAYNHRVASDLISSLGLVQKLEQQQTYLIEADEKARREIANLLHDSVQSKLVISATKLNAISSKAPDNISFELQQILLDLEDLRRLDVRKASRALSPDIELLGLQECLHDLSNIYKETMRISLDVQELPKEAEAKVGLAAYRICEQVLLNALVHGSAKSCELRLRAEKGWIEIEIDNDGMNLPISSQPAKGSAVIDAWVSRSQGDWSIRNLSSGAVRFAAKLEIDSAA